MLNYTAKSCLKIPFLLSLFAVSVFSQDGDLGVRIKADSLFVESIVLKENGRYEEAFAVAREAYSVDSASAAVMAELSRYILAFERDFTKAIDAMRQAVFLSPSIIDYKIFLAGLFSDAGDYSAAAEAYEELAKLRPAKNEFHIRLGELYIRLEEPGKALAQLNILENNNGITETVCLQKANIHLNAGEKRMALKEILKICEKFPENAQYLLMAGDLYLEINEYDAAIDIFKRCIAKIQADNGTAVSVLFGRLGDIYQIKGERDSAYLAYDKALEHNAANIVVLNNYAYALSLDKRDLDRAEQMVGRCVGADPANSTYLDTYAWVFFQKGNYRKAKLYIENALSGGRTDEADVFDHYGDILFQLGQVEKAVVQWGKALELKIRNGETDIGILQRKITEKVLYETPAK